MRNTPIGILPLFMLSTNLWGFAPGSVCEIDADCLNLCDVCVLQLGRCERDPRCCLAPLGCVYGDVNDDGCVDILDVRDLVSDGFCVNPPPAIYNLFPCGQYDSENWNDNIDLDDVLSVLDAFAGDFACESEAPSVCSVPEKRSATRDGGKSLRDSGKSLFASPRLFSSAFRSVGQELTTLSYQLSNPRPSPGECVELEVFVTNVENLVAYQFGFELLQGGGIPLQWRDCSFECDTYSAVYISREDWVFFDQQFLVATDCVGGRYGAISICDMVSSTNSVLKYLGTFVLKVPQTALVGSTLEIGISPTTKLIDIDRNFVPFDAGPGSILTIAP